MNEADGDPGPDQGPAPGIALAGAVVKSGNEWTEEGDGRLVLHPDPPDVGPVSMRFPDVDLSDRTGFLTTVRTNDERCAPVRLRFELRAPEWGELLVSDEIEVSGKIERPWRVGFPKLPERADAVLSCRLAFGIDDHRYSGVSLVEPRLTSGARLGKLLVRADPASPSVALLLDGRFDEYFGSLADNEESIWVFHHIAKTAGVSILTEVSKALKPMVNVFGDASSEFPDVESSLRHHLPSIASGSFRFATGHFDRGQVELVREQELPVRPFTFLRHPVVRYVSQYRYKLTPKDPDHEEMRARYPTLESYLEDDSARDVIFNRLRKTRNDTVDDVIADIEANYSFIGLTEFYRLSRAALFRLLGREPGARPLSRNRTEGVPGNGVEMGSLMPRLRELNRNDLQIYQHFAERFLGIQSDLERYLSSKDEG